MMIEKLNERTILRAVVGSTVHGLHVQDGLEDRDEMGICVEPLEAAFGLESRFEQHIYRSAAEREQKHDAPSRAGDLDLTIYSLHKWARLALKGNPTILILLFAPDPLVMTSRGSQLRELRGDIVSRDAGKAFLGYMQAQRQRMLGERGGLKVHRAAVVEKHGYDTKFAMHMCRLGFQGIELLDSGKISLPMPDPHRTYLLNMRAGKITLNEALQTAGDAEQVLRDLLDTTVLPPKPNVKRVEEFVLDTYLQSWKAHDLTNFIRRCQAVGVQNQEAGDGTVRAAT